MDLNDPFGRVSRRNQQSYQLFKRHLQQHGITDSHRLGEFSKRATYMLLKLLGLLFGTLGLLILVFPTALPALMLLCGTAALWGLARYLQTRLYLNRYRREHLSNQ